MRTPGIEPEPQPWKGCMLPLHHERLSSVFILYAIFKIHFERKERNPDRRIEEKEGVRKKVDVEKGEGVRKKKGVYVQMKEC